MKASREARRKAAARWKTQQQQQQQEVWGHSTQQLTQQHLQQHQLVTIQQRHSPHTPWVVSGVHCSSSVPSSQGGQQQMSRCRRTCILSSTYGSSNISSLLQQRLWRSAATQGLLAPTPLSCWLLPRCLRA